ncbi:MAG: hypothetical protein Q9209_003004 [Squamulea sp. 1 TL-2023]
MPTLSLPIPHPGQTFHTSLLAPPLAKNLASTIVREPLVLNLNTEIYMLASEASTLTFSSALRRYITQLVHCNDMHDIHAYIRACLQILVIYSLTQERYSWLQSCHYENIRGFEARLSALDEEAAKGNITF